MKNLLACLLFFFSLSILAQPQLNIHPNPFQNEVWLTVNPNCGDSLSFKILNKAGKVLLFHEMQASSPDTLTFQKEMTEGIFIIVYSENGSETTQKVVKQGNSEEVQLRLVLGGKALNCNPSKFEILPNPSKDGKFTIRQKHLSLAYRLSIFNLQGEFLLDEKVNLRSDADHTLDLSRFPDGHYLLKIKSQQGEDSFKLIKNSLR